MCSMAFTNSKSINELLSKTAICTQMHTWSGVAELALIGLLREYGRKSTSSDFRALCPLPLLRLIGLCWLLLSALCDAFIGRRGEISMGGAGGLGGGDGIRSL